MMKQLKRATALFLYLAMTFSQGAMSLAWARDDDPRDYSVSDVSFDVSNDHIYVNWSVDDSRISYTVQLYNSSGLKPKHKVGTAVAAGYTAGKANTTDKVLERGTGTYYAQVMAKKKAKGQGRTASAMGAEIITAEGIMMIKQNRGNTDETKTSATASTATNQSTAVQNAAAQTQTANAQNTGTQNTVVATGHWVSLENSGWSYVLNNGQRTTGWFQAGDKWHYAGSGDAMWVNAWIKSAAEEGVYYYVGYNSEMFVSAQTLDGYLVDYAGKWRP